MPTAAKPSWENASKVLCIRLDNFGDVLMTTPAIRAVKASRLGRQVTLLASPEGSGVAALIP
jgi:ADP-heptose:LPS heptosyltransferase